MMEGGNRAVAQDEPEPASSDDTAADESGLVVKPEPASGKGATGDETAADERGLQPKKGKKSKGKKGKKRGAVLSNEVRDAKFNELEQFHHNWFNLPPGRVKKSLENAIKFCKVACTRDQCSADTTVSNNCHLMCPASTLKNCPDLNPNTEVSPESPDAPPSDNQDQPQPSEESPGQTPPVVTVNGAPQEQAQEPVPQAPVPSEPNVILPADQEAG